MTQLTTFEENNQQNFITKIMEVDPTISEDAATEIYRKDHGVYLLLNTLIRNQSVNDGTENYFIQEILNRNLNFWFPKNTPYVKLLIAEELNVPHSHVRYLNAGVVKTAYAISQFGSTLPKQVVRVWESDVCTYFQDLRLPGKTEADFAERISNINPNLVVRLKNLPFLPMDLAEPALNLEITNKLLQTHHPDLLSTVRTAKEKNKFTNRELDRDCGLVRRGDAYYVAIFDMSHMDRKLDKLELMATESISIPLPISIMPTVINNLWA